MRGRLTAALLACSCAGATGVAAQSACPSSSLPAYSHNDYERRRPLHDALSMGFRGVEVDVFLVDGVLRVGHDRRAARSAGTLDSVYLAPLTTAVSRCGNLVHEGRAFLLAIEIKDRSPATYDTLMHTLYRYGALWMSRQDAAAPVEIVLVGWHPGPVTVSSDSLPGIQHRLTHPTALDAASLDPRVRLLSVDYGKTIGRWWRRAATRTRWLEAMRTSKRHTPHRLLRVHNVPPDSLVYEMLFAAGTDLIGTKQLEATARLLKARRAPSP